MNKTPQLIYCYDPMCSWCRGFKPTWEALNKLLRPLVESGELVIRPITGGLAIDSDEPMPMEMRQRLEATWQRIEASLGTEFNYDFWRNCQPRRSTYPACRACVVARDEGLEMEMYAAIQQAYYLEARNPSDMDTLTECAEQIGMQAESFLRAMAATKSSGRVEQEIREARQLGLNSFPSFAVKAGDKMVHINLDYQSARTMFDEIRQALINIT